MALNPSNSSSFGRAGIEGVKLRAGCSYSAMHKPWQRLKRFTVPCFICNVVSYSQRQFRFECDVEGSLEFRRKVKLCRTVGCVRRRNWSARLYGCSWPSVSSCLDTAAAAAAAAAAPWPELVTLERSGPHNCQCILTRATGSSDNAALAITLYRHHCIPLLLVFSFRSHRHSRVTEVTAALTCTVSLRDLPIAQFTLTAVSESVSQQYWQQQKTISAVERLIFLIALLTALIF